MSRQSKAAKKAIIAKAITKLHKDGNKGPKSTAPKHGKNASKRLYTAAKRGQNDRSREVAETK